MGIKGRVSRPAKHVPVCEGARPVVLEIRASSIFYRYLSARCCHSLRPVAEMLLDLMLVTSGPLFCVEQSQSGLSIPWRYATANSCRGPDRRTKLGADVICGGLCCLLVLGRLRAFKRVCFGRPNNADPDILKAHCAIQRSAHLVTLIAEICRVIREPGTTTVSA